MSYQTCFYCHHDYDDESCPFCGAENSDEEFKCLNCGVVIDSFNSGGLCLDCEDIFSEPIDNGYLDDDIPF